jgi:hypothetical protein
MVNNPLCKFESLNNPYFRLNIHDTANAFKGMERKFWCLRHIRFNIKNVMVCGSWMMNTLVVALSH